MIQVRISDDALNDLILGFRFYEAQETGLGEYFLSQLRADIDGFKISECQKVRPDPNTNPLDRSFQ